MTVANDPDFDGASTVEAKSAAREGSGRGRRRSQYRLRTGMLAVAAVGIWIGILVDPVVGPVVGWILGGIGLTLALMLGAMGLCWLGFGLFALGDRARAWMKRASGWPES